MSSRWPSRLARATSPFLGLVFILVVFLLYDVVPDGRVDDFHHVFTVHNVKLIAVQTTGIALGALGMAVVIASGGIDLSPGSVIALVTVVTALLLRWFEGLLGAPGAATSDSWTWAAAALAAGLAGVGVGGIAGLVNGILVTRLRLVPFIVTLGTMSVARGVAKWLAGEHKVNAPESWLNNLLRLDKHGPWWHVPHGIVVLGILAVLLDIVLRRSVFGRRVFAIGSNEATARLCGVNVGRQKLYVYTIAGVFAGLAGLLQFSELSGVGDPTGAVGRELYIIAAVVIGGGSLTGGKGTVAGTLIGAFSLGVLRNAASLYLLPTTVEEIAIGAIIVAAAAVDALRQRWRA